MNKKQISYLAITAVAFVILGSSVVYAGQGNNPFDQVLRALTSIFDAVEEVQTSIDLVESKMDGLDIESLKAIPILHYEELEYNIPQQEHHSYNIICDKPYELKAIHFKLADDREDVFYYDGGTWWWKEPSEYVWASHIWLSGYSTGEHSLNSVEGYYGFEVFNELEISVNPANNAGERTYVGMKVSNPDLIDFDETLTLKIIISAPQDADIEVSIN